MEHPKLRDSKRLLTHEPYPINEIPEDIIRKIGCRLVYMLCIGRSDLAGNDWGDIFAEVIGGEHFNSPVGVADVAVDKMAWSLKTVKHKKPFCNGISLRLISGRCSPDYSYGITDPHEDVQKTGRAVLNIWNERVNIAFDYYNTVRTIVLVRGEDMLSYSLFEQDIHRYPANLYSWKENRNGNLIGYEIETEKQRFTWQPHGSQLTIHTQLPSNAIKFRIKQPPILNMEDTLKQINYDDSWVEIL